MCSPEIFAEVIPGIGTTFDSETRDNRHRKMKSVMLNLLKYIYGLSESHNVFYLKEGQCGLCFLILLKEEVIMSVSRKISVDRFFKLNSSFASMVVLLLTLSCAGASFGQGGAYIANPKTAQEAIDQLVWANRILANEGIFDTMGHVTVRNPENPKTFFMARGNAPETVTKEDIIEVDMEGAVVTKTKFKPYSEWPIHAGIFKVRPDVNSVIHAHPTQTIIMSVIDMPFLMLTHLASFFSEGVPNYDEYDFDSPKTTGMLVQTKEEGDRVAKKLGKATGMLMRGHGCNVVGKSVPWAVQGALVFRDNILIQLAAQQYGKPKALTVEEARKAFKSLRGPEKGWEAWVMRVKKAMPDMN
jgi:ribulose-5-phosphate 4-epimerase/fuculose-1-phosphate aldolase